MSHKLNFKEKCEFCGKEFEAYRGPKQGRPRFCSLDCYWKSGSPAHSVPNWKSKQAGGEKPGRKRVYVGRVDGKPKYIARAHCVWNQAHPDDPVLPGDEVHHIDHNKQNDAPENLMKMNGKDHAIFHAHNIMSEEMSRRMSVYHQANPGKGRKGQVQVCPVCGKEFYRPPSAKAKTCSYKCMGELMKSKR
jgi:hypothetical protein